MHESQVVFKNVANNMKLLRKRNNYSQKQMSDIIGVNQSQYSKIERAIQPLTVCQLLQIAIWFEVDPRELLKTTECARLFGKKFICKTRSSHSTENILADNISNSADHIKK